jgi:4-amino-4-deoxy-L-arabinose transferase-like glycosyltransferase
VTTLRAAWRRVPSAGYWCALVAFLAAAAWSLTTPPFHVPDETAHVAYAQHLAENGTIPNDPGGRVFSDDQASLLDALQFPATVGKPNGTIWYEIQDSAVQSVESQPHLRGNGGGKQSNSNQPPLYYALTVPAYYAGGAVGGLLDRLAFMRLVSALLAACTTLFVYLFLRELFVEPWAWAVGALAVAFQPVFGFISGGVTPDTLLATASAALFFLLARTFNRGLTLRRGSGIGLALAVGALAKLNFLALIPGALLGLGVLVWCSRERLRALAGAASAVAILAAASVTYILLNLLVWDRSAWGGGETTATVNAGVSHAAAGLGLTSQIGYTWQLYLPRLPFMNDQFGYFPPYTTWFKGWIGVFGWLDTSFPGWAYQVALGIAVPIVVLAVVALVRRRGVLIARWAELLVYAVLAVGLLAAVGFSGIRYRHDTGNVFEQARYLLPLLPLYGALIALAALGAGRRFGRHVGAVLVLLAIGHTVFSLLLVSSRFYA